MLFRFWVFPDCTFLDISIAKLLDNAAEQNGKIPMPDLFCMMGMPTNWKRVTAYHKI